MNRLLRLLAVTVLAAASACGPASRQTPFQGVDVTGSSIGAELDLRDTQGKPRTLADFRGKVVVVAFGYTHCPDVCPMTLANLASARKRLGKEGDQVQVIFVSVDPKRDTPDLLARYVTAFDPTFLGLGGSPADVQRTIKDYRLFVEERPTGNGDYSVDHSAQIFAYDRKGRLRVVIPQTATPDAIASDLRVLLDA
ncbi:MAG TPA: SCO family protein [Usitatibacter sp.]|nr:SCO family protein [Usitatibacter sp.]